MKPILSLFVLCATLSLAACGSGPAKRVSAPTASVQELAVQADGSWRLLVRVQNFSNVSMTFDLLEAGLEVDGKQVGTISRALDLDVPGGSADVFETTLTPASAIRLEATDFAYRLKGRITSREPRGDFSFERASRLSPVPGLGATWR